MRPEPGGVVAFLTRLKSCPRSPLPREPEELAELLARISRTDRAAEIKAEAYSAFLSRGTVCVRLPLHFFTLDRETGAVRLFWIECETKRSYARTLVTDEARDVGAVFEVPELLRKFGPPAGANTGDRFRLQDLIPGERFRDEAGEVCQVCSDQPRPEDVQVWTHPDGIDARRVFLPRSAKAFPTCGEQARRIARRVRERRRRQQHEQRRKRA